MSAMSRMKPKREPMAIWAMGIFFALAPTMPAAVPEATGAVMTAESEEVAVKIELEAEVGDNAGEDAGDEVAVGAVLLEDVTVV